MRAMVMTDFGGPEVLQLKQVADPVPGERDLLIEVRACATNPVDCKTRMAPRWGDRKPPMILGFDVAGIVRGKGAKVQGFEIGDEVYASPSLVRDGANAELVCVDERTAAIKPRSVDFAHAAALPVAALTAWESLFMHGRMQQGETVLVHAGAGGVGHIAVQLARIHGCKVITTAGRPESIALCKTLGADHVIDYRTEDLARRVQELTSARGCDVILDAVGGEVFSKSLPLLAVYGRIVSIVPGVPTDALNALFAKSASAHFEFVGASTMWGVGPERQGRILREIAALVDAGRLKVHISQRYKLEQLPEAHRQQQSQRTLGKIVMDV